jgi:hypothetical protein
MERNRISTILILLLIAFLVFPVGMGANGPLSGCTISHDEITAEFADCHDTIDENVDEWGLCCLLEGIYTIVDWIFTILVAVTGIFVILGGFTIATAGGDPAKVSSGRNYILYAMIGLVVALFSRAIPALVKNLIS